MPLLKKVFVEGNLTKNLHDLTIPTESEGFQVSDCFLLGIFSCKDI